jgi:leucyl aminopeptidase (aminopeptidase T)
MGTLRFAAEQAIRNCLKLRRGEHAVLVTDRPSREIADALLSVLRESTPNVSVFVMEELGERPDDGNGALAFPESIAAAMGRATASIYAATGKRGELKSFRSPMLRVVDANPALRHAHMINITREVMEMGMSADYAVIQRLSADVHAIVRRARRIRVTSPRGTDFVAEINPDWKWIVSDGQITPEQWKNLPDGEVFTCAQSAHGRAVVDGCLGDHFSVLGTCESFPVTIDFEGGVVHRLRCEARPELERELDAYIHQDENANRVGEFAIGTNIGLDRIIGNLLQDEKFPGVHIALGHGYPEKTGSPWHSEAHLDVVMREVTVEVDGRTIMRGGKFVI